MAKMIPYDQVTDVRTGDVYVTNSVVPLIRHFGIAFYRGQTPMISDNSFINKQVNVFTLDDYKKSKTIYGIYRTPETLKVTDAQVEYDIAHVKPNAYRFFGFNCESWVRHVCKCNPHTDQRITWGFYLLVIIILVVVVVSDN